MKKIAFLLSWAAALSALPVCAQETPEAITVNAGQAFLLAGAGFIVQPAAIAAQAQQIQARAGTSSAYGNAAAIAGGAVNNRLYTSPVVTDASSSDDSGSDSDSSGRNSNVSNSNTTSGSGSSTSDGSTSASDHNAVVAKARAYMRNAPYNPNNGTYDWNGYCLGFVGTTLRNSAGEPSPMRQYDAKDAYFAMAHANLISNDTNHIPAGAPIFWPWLSKWGHVAIATGQISSDGSPMMITTSSRGIREMSVKQFGEGMPTGWGKL